MPGPKSMFLFVEEKILILGPSSFRPAQPGKVNGQGSRKGPFVSELLHSVPGLFPFLYLVF